MPRRDRAACPEARPADKRVIAVLGVNTNLDIGPENFVLADLEASLHAHVAKKIADLVQIRARR
jgi:hypothetical protein